MLMPRWSGHPHSLCVGARFRTLGRGRVGDGGGGREETEGRQGRGRSGGKQERAGTREGEQKAVVRTRRRSGGGYPWVPEAKGFWGSDEGALAADAAAVSGTSQRARSAARGAERCAEGALKALEGLTARAAQRTRSALQWMVAGGRWMLQRVLQRLFGDSLADASGGRRLLGTGAGGREKNSAGKERCDARAGGKEAHTHRKWATEEGGTRQRNRQKTVEGEGKKQRDSAAFAPQTGRRKR